MIENFLKLLYCNDDGGDVMMMMRMVVLCGCCYLFCLSLLLFVKHCH